MKKILILSFIILAVLTFSCATKSDYQQTNYEVNTLRNEMDRLHNDMAMFKKAYNPELQDVFSKNVLEAERYRNSIEKTKNDIEYISNQINGLLRQSENDRMLISENLKTSRAENVVNEFRQLNNEWDTTVIELSNLVKNSEKAVEMSHNAAMQAAEKAGSAERSAYHVSEYRNMLNKQSRSLDIIHEKLKGIESKIRKISKRLDDVDKPEKGKKKLKEKPEK